MSQYVKLASSSSHLPADERSPLLDNHRNVERHDFTGTAAEVQNLLHDDDPARRKRKVQLYLLIVVLAFVFVIDTGSYMNAAPQMAINERIVCDNYYSDAQLKLGQSMGSHLHWNETGRDCVVKPVVDEVTLISQVRESLDLLPGIILAMPFGILGDRIGRKPVLALSVFGLIAQDVLVKIICWFPWIFPIRLQWVTPLAQLFGGGSQVCISILYTILADTIDAKNRITAFGFVGSTVLITEIVAIPLAAYLTNKWSPWVPSLIALLLYCLSMAVVIFLLPETLPVVARGARISAQHQTPGTNQEHSENATPKPMTLPDKVKSIAKDFATNTSFILSDPRVSLLLSTFLIANLVRGSASFQIQYVHVVFHWSYARASFLLSIQAIATLFLLLAIFPLASHVMTRMLRFRNHKKDLVLARVSGLIWTAGAFGLAVASSITVLLTAAVVFAFGCGFAIATRSLITSLVAPTHVATVYTAIAVMQGLGGIAAGPMLTVTFKEGLKRGGGWTGLPWIALGVLLGIATIAVYFVRLGGGVEERTEEEDEALTRESAEIAVEA